MPAQKTTAVERPTVARIAGLRRDLLDELYHQYDQTGVKPLALEAIERTAIAKAAVMPGGYAVSTDVSVGYRDIEERLTVLTSLTRGDRVMAAMYTVRVGDGLVQEFPVTVGGPFGSLGRLASHVAAHTL